MDENTGSNSYYQDNTANLQYQQPPVEEGPSKANGLQVAGLILGILGIVTCCCYGIVGFIFSVIGLILREERTVSVQPHLSVPSSV